MPKPFPIAPAFPQLNWLGDLVLPQSPKATAQMSSGHISMLRIGKVQHGASFSAEWSDLIESELLAWQSFWREVDTWDVVSLPLGPNYSTIGGFFPDRVGEDLANYYRAASPTGWWRLKVPKIERLGLINRWAMVLEFEGVID